MSKRGGEGEDGLFDDDINGDMAEVKVEPPESPMAAASTSSTLTARYNSRGLVVQYKIYNDYV